MPSVKVRGIVIDQAPMGEKDKRLTVLTRESGKIPVLAKGARSQAGRMAAPSQLFCLSDLVLDSGRTFYYIREYDILETFYDLRTDIEKLSFASVLLEAARIFSVDGEDNGTLLNLLLRGLYAMQGEDADPSLITDTFLLRLLADHGFLPELSRCVRCGRPYTGEGTWYFHPAEGGLICPSCRRFETMKVSEGSVRAMRYITECPEQKVYRFQAEDRIRREIRRPIRQSVQIAAGFPLKTLSFAENLEATD